MNQMGNNNILSSDTCEIHKRSSLIYSDLDHYKKRQSEATELYSFSFETMCKWLENSIQKDAQGKIQVGKVKGIDALMPRQYATLSQKINKLTYSLKLFKGKKCNVKNGNGQLDVRLIFGIDFEYQQIVLLDMYKKKSASDDVDEQQVIEGIAEYTQKRIPPNFSVLNTTVQKKNPISLSSLSHQDIKNRIYTITSGIHEISQNIEKENVELLLRYEQQCQNFNMLEKSFHEYKKSYSVDQAKYDLLVEKEKNTYDDFVAAAEDAHWLAKKLNGMTQTASDMKVYADRMKEKNTRLATENLRINQEKEVLSRDIADMQKQKLLQETQLSDITKLYNEALLKIARYEQTFQDIVQKISGIGFNMIQVLNPEDKIESSDLHIPSLDPVEQSVDQCVKQECTEQFFDEQATKSLTLVSMSDEDMNPHQKQFSTTCMDTYVVEKYLRMNNIDGDIYGSILDNGDDFDQVDPVYDRKIKQFQQKKNKKKS